MHASHLSYVNPSAPKGGALKLKAHTHTFDTFNLFSDWGVVAPQIEWTFATLMMAPLDDPAVLYPYIVQDVSLAGKVLTLALNLKATFNDKTMLRATDVKATLEWLKKHGALSLRMILQDIDFIETPGLHKVVIHFKNMPSEDALFQMLQLPVLAASDLKREALFFKESPFKGSGPYSVSSYSPGHFVTYERTPNWWGQDLFVNKGCYNFDHVTFIFYKSEDASLEGFKKGEYDIRQEMRAIFWEKEYNFPAISRGEVLREVLPLNQHLGLNGLFMNTKAHPLDEINVRKALSVMFDFGWLNETMLFHFYVRNQNIFMDAPEKMSDPISDHEKFVNKAYHLSLDLSPLEEAITAWKNVQSLMKRERFKEASKLLEGAGFKLIKGKRITPKTGKQMTLTLVTNRPGTARLLQFYVDDLSKLGIKLFVRILDDVTFQKVMRNKEYDIIHHTHTPSFFPVASHATALWGSRAGKQKRSLNLSQIQNPVVDKLLAALQSARTKSDLFALAQLLNRVIYRENYFIPMWTCDKFYVAYWNKFDHPKTHGAFSLETWWSKE